MIGLSATTGNRRSRKQNSALNDVLMLVSVSSRVGGKQPPPSASCPRLGVVQVAGIASSELHGPN